MKSLIKVDAFGMVERKGQAMTTSLFVAEYFGKDHDKVVRELEKIGIAKSGDTSERFYNKNFEETSYRDEWNRKRKMYLMTKNGFALLAMGFTGEKAREFKIAYINQFDMMEQFIIDINAAKLEHPILTEAIKGAHNPVMKFHYSNEADLINRVVLGKSAKQFREEHGIEKGESIRPYVTDFEIKAIRSLQGLDAGLILANLSSDQRKLILTEQLASMQRRELAKVTI